MRIFANLRASEDYLDHLTKELNIVSDLITLLNNQKESAKEESIDKQRFLAEQLCYMQKEEERIRLRREFAQEMFGALRHASDRLEDSLNAASYQLSSSKER